MSFYDGLAFVGDTMNQSETEGGSGHRRRGLDYPGERPSKADREKWVREWPRCLNPEQKTVLRGGVPAKLAAETAEFEMTDLPALAHGAGETAITNREAARATRMFENRVKANKRAASLR